MYGETDAWLVRGSANYAVFDPVAGELIERQHASDLAPLARLVQSVDPLHFGNFGGLLTKLVWLIAGLMISLSILVGTQIWYLRTTGRQEQRKKRKGLRWMITALVTLPVLGLATYGSIVNIRASIASEPASLRVNVYDSSEVMAARVGATTSLVGAEVPIPPPHIPAYVWARRVGIRPV